LSVIALIKEKIVKNLY